MKLELLKQKATRVYIKEIWEKGNIISSVPCWYTKKYGYRFNYLIDGKWQKINCNDLKKGNLFE